MPGIVGRAGMCYVYTHAHYWDTSCLGVSPMTRIHILLDESEKERYRRQAERVGMSLGAWLRQAARDKLAVEERRTQINTLQELRALFETCDVREGASEPDWNEHRRVIEASRRSGLAPT